MTRRKKRKPASSRRPRPGASITIDVCGGDPGLRRLIRRTVRAALLSEGRDSGRLEVAVVDERDMKRLHRRWMGDPRPTDVLTFDFSSKKSKGARRPPVDGQLVVCESVAQRRAESDRRDWRNEVLLYVVHGCLHLCGYNDRQPGDAARMHRREDEILLRLGRGPIFFDARVMR
ncbi:MAG TPA: rRNA maturation RNase YbeY [Phycisphaerae bacterium]|nr:rRNA maturation RNase YbeY [Phycisphaerae bacterium]